MVFLGYGTKGVGVEDEDEVGGRRRLFGGLFKGDMFHKLRKFCKSCLSTARAMWTVEAIDRFRRIVTVIVIVLTEHWFEKLRARGGRSYVRQADKLTGCSQL